MQYRDGESDPRVGDTVLPLLPHDRRVGLVWREATVTQVAQDHIVATSPRGGEWNAPSTMFRLIQRGAHA